MKRDDDILPKAQREQKLADKLADEADRRSRAARPNVVARLSSNISLIVHTDPPSLLSNSRLQRDCIGEWTEHHKADLLRGMHVGRVVQYINVKPVSFVRCSVSHRNSQLDHQHDKASHRHWCHRHSRRISHRRDAAVQAGMESACNHARPNKPSRSSFAVERRTSRSRGLERCSIPQSSLRRLLRRLRGNGLLHALCAAWPEHYKGKRHRMDALCQHHRGSMQHTNPSALHLELAAACCKEQ